MSGLLENYATVPLAELAPVSKERSDPNEIPESPYIGLEHIERNTAKLADHGKAVEVKSTKSVFRKGDLLYGKLRPYLNKVWLAEFDGLCSTDILVFPQGDSLDNRFLKYRFLARDFVNYATSNSSGVNLPRVNAKVLGDFTINLPPLPEQRRIVARIEELFSRLDAGVDALRHAKAQLQRYRKSVLNAAVTGKITTDWRRQQEAEGRSLESGEELLERILKQRREQWKGKGKYNEPESPNTKKLTELPPTWQWSSLGQAFDVHVGATPSRKEPSYWDGGIPWVSSGEVAFCRIRTTAETITQKGLDNSSTSLHPPGTVMVGMIGEGKTRGQVAILDIEACHNQNSAAIRVSMSPVSPEFVYYYLEHRYEETRGGSSGGNQPALNKARVSSIPLPLPPLAEQKQIVAEVEARTTAIDHLEAELDRQISRSNKLRESLLSHAFRGGL